MRCAHCGEAQRIEQRGPFWHCQVCARRWRARRVVGGLLAALLVAAPCFAQAHAEVVGAVKNDLLRAGADLSGPCGALKITRAVAQALVSEAAGLLDKPAGNNCESFAVDIIAYPDGRAFDILTDSGGSNGPAWQPIAPVDPSRYRAVGSAPPPIVPPPVSQPPAGLVIDYDRIAALIHADGELTRAEVNAPGWLKKFLSNPVVQMAIAGIGTCVATRCWERFTQPQAQ